MKDCAQQAERFVKDWEKVPKGFEKLAEGVRLFGWENHYSPKYGRCYVALSIHTDQKMYPKVPEMHDEMFDAFEVRQLATCALFEKTGLCSVTGRNISGDCDACRQFIDEHMNN